ncbi:MAG: prephenate dehydrogenase/arogenate dehydrogenase family protein [Desulfobulbaceae bacterium]|nr:prephenate dehydrogenase/arogenate dehydrogenase family protein [Desulfobulbaceae bacterium]
MTRPLDDRVGLLVDILSEFSRRGINFLDMRAENDIKTQKLSVYIEAEGHVEDPALKEVITQIEENIIRQTRGIQVIGSFPRIDMRARHIRSIGFIGTGAMSSWFADRLVGDGYKVSLCGRNTELRPEDLIAEVDVVMICVPISATRATIQQYGPLLKAGQGLILLAGESETTLVTALESTVEGVEVMLVHNLWGPQAATMKDKNAIIVRTPRSGKYCSEIEAFLYEHGANIYHDSASKHDLLMGMGQKLPTVMSVALAMTLKQNNITKQDITSHSTLTSLYPILAMSRVHSQNPRTYAEIMSISGEGRKLVHDFLNNIKKVVSMADQGMISDLCALIDDNSRHLTKDFLEARMSQAKAVDEVLGSTI